MERFSKRVYIACPISIPDPADPLHNAKQADEVALKLFKAGIAWFNPHLSVYAGGARMVETCGDGCCEGPGADAHPGAHGGYRDLSHHDWLQMDFAWLDVCHAVLRLLGSSKGADMEEARALEKGIPVFHDIDECIRFLTEQGRC